MISVGLALSALAACSSPQPPAPPTNSQTTTATSSAVPTVAPPVTNPLDIRPFATKPCALLTASERARIGFGKDAEEPRETYEPISCFLRQNEEPVIQLELVPYPGTDKLGELYAKGPENYDVFERRTIAGKPAIVRQTSAGARDCSITIGTADNQAVEVVWNNISSPALQPCPSGIEAAEAAVSKLGPLSP